MALIQLYIISEQYQGVFSVSNSQIPNVIYLQGTGQLNCTQLLDMYDRDYKTFGRAIQISAFVYSLISNTNAPMPLIMYSGVQDISEHLFIWLWLKSLKKKKKSADPGHKAMSKILRQFFCSLIFSSLESERKTNLQNQLQFGHLQITNKKNSIWCI